MTYREQLQRLIQVIDLAYDLAGGLRDAATPNEKEAFNLTRGSTSTISSALRRMDNLLDDNRASMELGDSFDKYIKKTLDL